MDLIRYPAEALDNWLPLIDQSEFNPDHYRQLGVMVLRRVVPSDVVSEWMSAWAEFQTITLADGRNINPYNPVVLNEPPPAPLADIYRHPVLLDLMEQLYPDLGFYLQRFVVKDVHNRASVFLHQDYCYNLGWPDKTSIFVPLSQMNPENGGLVLYPGTHRLGYLGDAGQIDPDILDPAWPSLAPALEPGDVVLMHDCTWHSSLPRQTDVERILVQITYQPADDPSNKVFLRGKSDVHFSLANVDPDHLFKRSRSSRLRELQGLVSRTTA